jgi:hypothetical protein
VSEDSRRLHNEEFHDLYFSSNIIGMIKSRRKGCPAKLVRVEITVAYRVSVATSEGKRLLQRPMCRRGG